jgi:hypothetical protein
VCVCVCVCGRVSVPERNFTSRAVLSVELPACLYRFSTSYQQTPPCAVSLKIIVPVQ